MQAVIKTGGKQYLVEENQVLRVEKLDTEEGKDVTFEPLLVADGKDIKVGTPTVTGAKVSAKVMENGRGKKIRVVKYKNKTRYSPVTGHRQAFSQIKIKAIKA